MSDGLDPRHAPKRAPTIPEWAHELTYVMLRKGLLASDVPLHKVTREITDLAETVVRAPRDGHFTEVT
jgi:hypothetical protein